MKTTWYLAVLAILMSAAAVGGPPQGPDLRSDKATASSDWSQLEESMAKMHVAMRSVERSRNSDVNFVRLMLPHHQAAIDMARTQLMYGKDPEMRRLAQEIITDQQSEILVMQLWLKQRDHK